MRLLLLGFVILGFAMGAAFSVGQPILGIVIVIITAILLAAAREITDRLIGGL